MIAFIDGVIEDIADENVVLEVNHIGYNVKISSNTAGRLPGMGERVKLYTYTCVREDAFLLYGFLLKNEFEIFKKCITVTGIGPKGALAILSVMDADSLRLAIISGDVKAISKAPGVGRKTAERLILDLKDKISMGDAWMGQETDAKDGSSVVMENMQKKEAVEALVSLGYGQMEAMKTVKSLENTEDMDSGALLKAALKKLV